MTKATTSSNKSNFVSKNTIKVWQEELSDLSYFNPRKGFFFCCRESVRFAEEDLWLTQGQLAEIYDTTKQNISQHIDNILIDGELSNNRTVKEFLIVRQEGNRQVKRNIVHYNLDMIITCFSLKI